MVFGHARGIEMENNWLGYQKVRLGFFYFA